MEPPAAVAWSFGYIRGNSLAHAGTAEPLLMEQSVVLAWSCA